MIRLNFRHILVLLLSLDVVLKVVHSVDRGKFRTCNSTGFCSRHRGKINSDIYSLVIDSLSLSLDNHVNIDLKSSNLNSPILLLDVSYFNENVPRVRILEKSPLDGNPRWEPSDIILDTLTTVPIKYDITNLVLTILPATTSSTQIVIDIDSLQIKLVKDDREVIALNSRSMFNFEHTRRKDGSHETSNNEKISIEVTATLEGKDDANLASHGEVVEFTEAGEAIYEDGFISKMDEDDSSAAEATNEEGMWDERFGGHTDSKPFGPQAVTMDIKFINSVEIYGIPEHATSMALKPTFGGVDHGAYEEPYRLYNLDVFEYELDVPMALYGSIPFMLGHGSEGTSGVFWLNPSETFIDVSEADTGGRNTHWMSESGIIDIILFPGPNPKQVHSEYAKITGSQAFPPMFAIAYHQCRWNYKDEIDVRNVHGNFEEYDFPFDVLWLDIEHTDGKRYFTWDEKNFPNPIEMQNELSKNGRKMVTIVDPHMKRDSGYKVHTEATKKGYYIKDKNGKDFDGWCWPGSSSYLDFTSSDVRSFWASQFEYDNYIGSTDSLFIWNDMNEPSVFNGPEVSMAKDCKSISGVEHRHWHNLYGFYQQMATAEGLILRNDPANKRPFVLSRAFFAGSQRYGAIWTGDNMSKWSHLEIATPMLLTQGLAGLSFSGADVGGFFGNPSAELMIRWYQAGAYQPFFRAHAHIDTKRREPWLFQDEEENALDFMRSAVRTRYALLPYMYSLFKESNDSGVPIMRALWTEFPGDETTWTMDDQFLLGSDLLIKPVYVSSQSMSKVYLPGAGKWYPRLDGSSVVPVYGNSMVGNQFVDVETPLSSIPVFQRGGSIIPTKQRARRSSLLMKQDPYTLTVALDNQNEAYGELYIDDEETFDYKKGHYLYRSFSFKNMKLCNAPKNLTLASTEFQVENKIERVIILGLKADDVREISVHSSSTSTESKPLQYQVKDGIFTIRKPDVRVSEPWCIEIK